VTVYDLSFFGVGTVLAFFSSYLGKVMSGSLIVASGRCSCILSFSSLKVTLLEVVPSLGNVCSFSSSGFSFEFLVLGFLRLPFKKVEFEEVECILDN
jgi:hypothetical protein